MVAPDIIVDSVTFSPQGAIQSMPSLLYSHWYSASSMETRDVLLGRQFQAITTDVPRREPTSLRNSVLTGYTHCLGILIHPD